MAARKFVYVPGAVSGSSAYDFGNPDLVPDQYGNTRPQEMPKTRTRTKVTAKPAAQARTKYSVAPTAVIGMLIAGFLLVTMIMAKAQLMTISAQSATLSSQLSQASVEQAKLKVAYQSAFNFTDIERYAIQNLGMQKPNADQIIYVDTASADKATVITDSGEASSFDKFVDFITSIGGLLK